jgi:hypothetical protein
VKAGQLNFCILGEIPVKSKDRTEGAGLAVRLELGAPLPKSWTEFNKISMVKGTAERTLPAPQQEAGVPAGKRRAACHGEI